MVNLWWIAGESWYVDGRFSGSKNMPRILDLFLTGSCFGNDQVLMLEDEVFGMYGLSVSS